MTAKAGRVVAVTFICLLAFLNAPAQKKPAMKKTRPDKYIIEFYPDPIVPNQAAVQLNLCLTGGCTALANESGGCPPEQVCEHIVIAETPLPGGRKGYQYKIQSWITNHDPLFKPLNVTYKFDTDQDLKDIRSTMLTSWLIVLLRCHDQSLRFDTGANKFPGLPGCECSE
jgi:hypothetical protein